MRDLRDGLHGDNGPLARLEGAIDGLLFRLPADAR
jgi:hypothetical protein